ADLRLNEVAGVERAVAPVRCRVAVEEARELMHGTQTCVDLREQNIRVGKVIVEWMKRRAQGLHRRHLIPWSIDAQEPAPIAIGAKEPDAFAFDWAANRRLGLRDSRGRCASSWNVVAHPARWGVRKRAAPVKRVRP